jgi:hypothetical protein
VKARRKGQVGPQIPILQTCSPKLPKAFPSIPPSAMPRIAPLCMPTVCPTIQGSETLAVRGRGYGYCSWAGNCHFWIYRKHRSKYKKLFEADNVQAFGFLPTRGNLLFLWTRKSAVRFSARVLELNGAEYHHSDGWIEQYQCEDEDGQFIASWFCLCFGGLAIPRLSGYLCSGRLLRRARFSERSVMLPASDQDAARIATFKRLKHVLLGCCSLLKIAS